MGSNLGFFLGCVLILGRSLRLTIIDVSCLRILAGSRVVIKVEMTCLCDLRFPYFLGTANFSADI